MPLPSPFLHLLLSLTSSLHSPPPPPSIHSHTSRCHHNGSHCSQLHGHPSQLDLQRGHCPAKWVPRAGEGAEDSWLDQRERRVPLRHHCGDGRLPSALHLVRRSGGGPAKWRHLSGEQGVCRDDPNGRTMGGALQSGGHAHQLYRNKVNLGGKR